MEPTTTEFMNQFILDKCPTLEDLVNDFDKYMPQIKFTENESILETLKKNYLSVANQTTAYGESYHPYYLLDFLKDPKNNQENFIGRIENLLRHQGSIYTQTYYVIIFLIEILNREEDAIISNNSDLTIPLRYQIYYENYIFHPIFNNYIHGQRPEFIYNTRNSEIYNQNVDPDSNDSRKLNQVKDGIGQKLVSLVHEHLLPLKDKLIEKCKREEITPMRALWLSIIPLTYEDVLKLDSIIKSIKNKYIRSSLFFVAGVKKLSLIKKLANNRIENNAYDTGYEAIKYKEYMKINQDDKKFKFKDIGTDGIKIFNHYNLGSKYDHYDFINNVDHRDSFIAKFNNLHESEMTQEDYNLLKSYHSNYKSYFTFYPFYKYGRYLLKNWHCGLSCGSELIEEEYSKFEKEYENYYRNHNSKTYYFLDDNEDSDFIKLSRYDIVTTKDLSHLFSNRKSKRRRLK